VISLIEMQVYGVNLDAITNQPVIILKQTDAFRFLPIWIGQFEATAILMEVQGIKPARPLTHDLLKAIIESMKAEVKQIVINDLKDGTFFAQIHLVKNGNELEVDSRPSDAIALAIRAKVPIYASEKVIEKASIVSPEGEEDEIKQFREFLKTVRPEDFQE
jgi:bifunctional DNase/RNase